MAKLKSLRASVGAYGRVAARGIVEVEENDVKKLTEKGLFVRATPEDIETAQRVQAERLKLAVIGAGATFEHVAAGPAPIEDELQAMELADLRVKLDERAQTLHVEAARLQGEADRLTALEGSLAERRQQLDLAADELKQQSADLEVSASMLDGLSKDLQGREDDLAVRMKAADDADAVRAEAERTAAEEKAAEEAKNKKGAKT